MIKIRPFKASDAETIASWFLSEKEYYECTMGKFGAYPVTADVVLNCYESITNTPDMFQMVAYDEDGLIAHVLFYYPNEEDTSIVRIGVVVVNSSRRGMGYGKDTLKQFTSYAHHFLGASKVSVRIFSGNRNAYNAALSVGFYETNEIVNEHMCGTDWEYICMECINPDIAVLPSKEEVLEEKSIEKIIRNNNFAYAFQPIVSASTGDIYGYEALMRAEDNGHSISPAVILKYAEENNKLYDIEKATFFNVLSRYESRHAEFKDRRLFVNSLPGYQLVDSDYKQFCDKFSNYFDKLTVEVTEHSELVETELEALLARSANEGFNLAIDDYGTGFSNTASLLRYLPSCVKIDRLLISNLQENTKKQHFVRGIVEFAHANGILALAEGVETYGELNSAIEMGIDLIQGFYIARPSFEILDEIPDAIRSEIHSSNVKGQTPDTRKIYVVSEDEKELPLMRIALEQNTGILFSSGEYTLVGNNNYCAEMSIKIKDKSKCTLTIRDVFVESILQLPCLELGQNVELTLVLEGINRMRKLGIFVPASSSIKIVGDGILGLQVQGIQSYGIGNVWDGITGKIEWGGSGSLDILVEADEGIGIGGGISGKNSSITLNGGVVRIEPACNKSIAIGYVQGNSPIEINDCNVQLDLKTDNGIGIGCAGDEQNTRIIDSDLNIICAGTRISAIGNHTKTAGTIDISNTNLTVLANGQSLCLIGANEGELNINLEESSLSMRAEGNDVLGIGTRDMGAKINAIHTNTSLKISSSTPLAFGAETENLKYTGGTRTISVNE